MCGLLHENCEILWFVFNSVVILMLVSRKDDRETLLKQYLINDDKQNVLFLNYQNLVLYL